MEFVVSQWLPWFPQLPPLTSEVTEGLTGPLPPAGEQLGTGMFGPSLVAANAAVEEKATVANVAPTMASLLRRRIGVPLLSRLLSVHLPYGHRGPGVSGIP